MPKTIIHSSHIHENVTMRFLTCEPNLQQKDNYKDEADRFYDAPMRWLHSRIPVHPLTALPTHVVLYDSLKEEISEFLTNYKLLHQIQHVEVKRVIDSQALLDGWSSTLGTKTPNLNSLLKQLQSRSGSSILVYQRLKAGEENTYNREEFLEEKANVEEPQYDNLANENVFN